MSKDQRKLRLGASSWRPGITSPPGGTLDADADAGLTSTTTADWQTAERGKFDLVFVADSPAGWNSPKRDVLQRTSNAAHFEPVTLWAALSQVTTNIGFCRHGLHHLRGPLSAGPALCPLDYITSAELPERGHHSPDVSSNFSIAGHPATPPPRAGRGFVDLVKGLGSLRGRCLPPRQGERVFLNLGQGASGQPQGKHFTVSGLLNVGRPVQGIR
jgi:alkanesulfonate monooxygenase SsuD/methylene tetrahydromethanopterin reductase-like flavin-dependent oxidoreductase (luciferase family)